MSAPVNSIYTQAQSTTIASFPITANNSLSVGETGVPTAYYNPLWYTFNSPNDGTLQLTVGSAFEIAVFTNNILQELDPVVPLTGSGDNITVPILNNLTYSILVYSVTNSATGAFTLSANFTPIAYPSNDNFANATTLTGNLFSISIDNSLATTELYEDPTNYFSVWYRYTALQTGQFTLSQTAGIPINFKIYVGSDTQNAVQLAASNNSISVPLLEGVTYYIAVNSQSSASYGAFSFTGVKVNQLAIQYIGPQSSPALAFNSNGLNSIVFDSSNQRIYVLNPAIPTVYYSTDYGVTWNLDRTFTFANPPYAPILSAGNTIGIFLDENGNLVFAFFSSDTVSNYYANFSVRNKSTGIWTDYTSSAIPVLATNYTLSSNFCQSDDGMIHGVITIVKACGGFLNSTSNILYCNFKDGTISTCTTITKYQSSYPTSDGVGIHSIQLVNWKGGVYIFWRNNSDSTNANGPLNYCQITPSAPLVMDAIVAALLWTTTSPTLPGGKYQVDDLVTYSGIIYVCLIAHTPTVFATNLAAGDWAILSSYTTPTTVPTLVNNDVYNVKSDGTNIYFIVSHGGFMQGSFAPIYKNFVDITPYTHPFWVAGMNVDAFEIAMNGDMVVYGEIIGGNGLCVMQINGVWQTGWQGQGILSNMNLDFGGGHTYNYAQLV